MLGYKKIPYRGADHGGFDDEWGLHSGCSEWWYATGCLNGEDGRLYSYQITILHVKISLIRPYLVMLALTDYAAGRHYYYQNIRLRSKDVVISRDAAGYGGMVMIRKGEAGMSVTVWHERFSLDLELGYGKGAVWHCDNGLLRMGIPGERETTVYYSYTNMPTEGTLTLNKKAVAVTGKTWFDKQGGPYSIMNRLCMWEWFSLRFFDDEEIMLFSFPQDDYQDGTYIRLDGSAERLRDYTITPTEFTYPDGKTVYSSAWRVALGGIKEGSYSLRPLMKGQMNIGYYELLAGVYNDADEQVGLCFVELLPGARNKKYPVTIFARPKGAKE